MEPSQFDELTKALATATSRRQALRRLGGILGGTALAGLFPGLAFASNSACTTFCNAVFGAETKAAGKCISDAAHGKGLCHTCGSSTPASSICCTRNSSGFCSSYSPTLPCSCPSGQVCQNGACVLAVVCLGQPCSNDTDCCQGAFCTATFCNTGGVGVCCGAGGTHCTSDNDCCCGAGCDLSTNTCNCFTAGTLIAMADGTSRPIEHVLVGDLVLGNVGRVNRVTQIHLPLLGQRPLYALNGSGYFVTSGHPFMTGEGWKAIDPSTVPPQISALNVGRLTVGDRVLALTGVAVPAGRERTNSGETLDVRIEAITLESLTDQAADPATQLYNLQLDGDHTYFANGLLVHNK